MVVAHAAGFGFGLGFLNFLGTLVFFAAMFMLFSALMRGGRAGWRGPWARRGHHGRKRHRRDEALELARERLARSEITADEFEAIRKGLNANPTHGYVPSSEATWPWQHDDALETVRLRFARGELSAEDFEVIKRALQS
jgi:uncharacterized membrane protein